MDRYKLNIYVFYALALLQGMVFYGPIATLYRQAKGLSIFEITLIESISLILMILLEVPWGWVADRIGYKKTMIICNFLFFVSKIVFYESNGFFGFLLERLLLSIVLSGLSGCDLAYIYLSKGKWESQKIFGVYNSMGTTGLIIASGVYSLFIKDDYSLSAFLTIISYGIALLLTFLFKEVKPPKKEHKSAHTQLKVAVSSFLLNKRFILFLLAAALLLESNQTITVFMGQLQYVRSGVSPQYMGYITILVTGAGLLSFSSHSVAKKVGEMRLIRSSFITAALSCICLAIFANPWVSIIGIVLLRISAAMFNPLQMDIQNRQVTIPDRATMLSIYSSILNLIGVLTNLLFGKTAGINVGYSMATGAIFCVAGLLLCILWQKNLKENRI